MISQHYGEWPPAKKMMPCKAVVFTDRLGNHLAWGSAALLSIAERSQDSTVSGSDPAGGAK